MPEWPVRIARGALQILEWKMADRKRWRPVLFDCPQTGQKVQGLLAEPVSGTGEVRYEPVSCLACSGVHFIDPVKGKVLGARNSI